MKKIVVLALLGGMLLLTAIAYCFIVDLYNPKVDRIDMDIFITIDSPDSRLVGFDQN